MKRILLLVLALLQSVFLPAQDQNYTEWYLQCEDVDIFVKETGHGKDTVIVVHGGFGANHDYMTDAIKGLEKEFRFVLYDQRGSLMSPTKKENLTFQKNIDDLLALTKALKLKKVKLFCHSMGTLVGMEFTEQHPDLVSHLVLSGTILPRSDSLGNVFSERHKKQVDFLVNRKEVKTLIGPFKAKGIDNLRSVQDIDTSGLSHKDLTEYWRINFAAINIYDVSKHHLLKGGRAYYKQASSVMTETVNWSYDYRDVLNNKAKTTIINGDHDFFDFQGRILKTLLKGYNRIELKIIAYAGHNSWIDNPLLFKNNLAAALTR
ncbi:alpha/beta fold hydrolase [Sinomicrobium weinanense]|uniref:Alpha/beta hydrolase n=1 Tax=Sinomicrobium weinanense TaxID=2842200 RepID=A0A926Q2F9_9FLAO|nr:alpha/beta hydrolase [Sinomicrobium weinanense]MBC9794876.1 alpha/beta hydrolase [Sinomicrobium weinanense]MBU3125647.1 alpha/beta hydrolase [Sinomicrobium weinanense]